MFLFNDSDIANTALGFPVQQLYSEKEYESWISLALLIISFL